MIIEPNKQKPMQMTEDEATHRLCPLSFNRGRDQTCVGSECMAWRWVGKDGTKGFCGFPAQFPSR